MLERNRETITTTTKMTHQKKKKTVKKKKNDPPDKKGTFTTANEMLLEFLGLYSASLNSTENSWKLLLNRKANNSILISLAMMTAITLY